jgi:hypothetical protein
MTASFHTFSGALLVILPSDAVAWATAAWLNKALVYCGNCSTADGRVLYERD